ncbi:hypothetical protein OG320_08950 [Microbispora sp. NBC_01189]|uniref:hypothetical protein n=1 Tax=Microbispora sp. NBC_01189 TaxID=2903583 RepID=UPI002E1569AF|nr:hypothetical protein OG320_08950 [Microbispora sp. NBC_01189]
MKIPRGATGIFDRRDKPSWISFDEVVSTAHLVALALHLRVRQVADGQGSFWPFVIEDSKRPIAMLFHKVIPVVALAEPPGPGGMEYDFIDHDQISDMLLNSSPFRVLGKEMLDAPIESCDLAELGRIERKLVSFWEPNTVGELLFNLWD